MTVAIYLRVSTQEQSTEFQKREIAEFLKAKGWSSFAIYEDKSTGTSSNRPELRKMLKDAQDGSVGVIVCWKLDRLFRSLKDLVNTLSSLSEWEVDFISIKDNIDMSTASGRLMTHLLAAFAEFEASLIKERVCAGLANAKAKGKTLGRPRQINPITVYELRLKGMSLSEIAKAIGVTKSGVSKTLRRYDETKALKKAEIIDVEDSGEKVE